LDKLAIKQIMTTDVNNPINIDKIEKSVEIYHQYINVIMLKYIINTEIRRAHFLGQGAVESGSLTSMQESSQQQIEQDGRIIGGQIVAMSLKGERELGHWYGSVASEYDSYFSQIKYNSHGVKITGSYSWMNGNCGGADAQKFRGRGFKMLTGRSNYASYWLYRGWIRKEDFDNYWWDDKGYKLRQISQMKKRPAIINDPQKITENGYNAIDIGGYFIRGIKPDTLRAIDKDKCIIFMNRQTLLDEEIVVTAVTKKINGGNIGLSSRKKFTRKAKDVLL
jgi:predicted chitinase